MILLKDRMKSIPATVKMASKFKQVYEQLNFRRAVRSQKKLRMILSAQKEFCTKRGIQQRNRTQLLRRHIVLAS